MGEGWDVYGMRGVCGVGVCGWYGRVCDRGGIIYEIRVPDV